MQPLGMACVKGVYPESINEIRKSDLFNCGRICKYCGTNMDTIDIESLRFEISTEKMRKFILFLKTITKTRDEQTQATESGKVKWVIIKLASFGWRLNTIL